MYSLKEVIKLIEIDRSTIQNYENEGIAIKPTTKNNRGHLRYGEKEIERLWQIKLYKELGKTMPEIKAIIKTPDYSLKKELPTIIDGLIEKKNKLEKIIEIAKILSDNSFYTTQNFIEYLAENNETFEKSTDKLIGLNLEINDLISKFDDNLVEEHIVDKEYKTYIKLDKVITKYTKKIDVNPKKANEYLKISIKEVLNIASQELCKSPEILMPIMILIIDELTSVNNIDDKTKEKVKSEIINNIEIRKKDSAYKSYDKILEEIKDLGSQKYTTNSDEVQNKVKEFVELVKINYYDEFLNKMIIKGISNSFLNGKIKEMMDGDVEKGYSWFIGRSFEIFLKNERN